MCWLTQNAYNTTFSKIVAIRPRVCSGGKFSRQYGELTIHLWWVVHGCGMLTYHLWWIGCARVVSLYGKLLWQVAVRRVKRNSQSVVLGSNCTRVGFICLKVHCENWHKPNPDPDHYRPTSLGWVFAITNPRGGEVLHCLYCLACDDCGFPGDRTLGQF